MPRMVRWGTPGRSEHYVRPRGKWALFLILAVLGAGVTVSLLFLNVVGLRTAVSPGSVISQHAPVEARCEECHTALKSVSNLRCQRCHDPSGGGRLANAAHVFFGTGDLKKASAAQDLGCAECHIEHRGRRVRLSAVNPAQCSRCHFRSFSGHPEFAVLKSKFSATPGILFSHVEHIKDVLKDRALTDPGRTCAECHRPQGRDFEPITFDIHCARCHGKNGQLEVGTDDIPRQDVFTREQILALDATLRWIPPDAEFENSPKTVTKKVVHHKDEWVLFNLRRLRREVDPEGFAAERSRLQARLGQLQRRLALATPPATLDLKSLKDRVASLEAELQALDARISGQAQAKDPGSSLSRLEEVLAAAEASKDTDAVSAAQKARDEADALKRKGVPEAALPLDEREARRTELLKALDTIDSADPRLKYKTDELRLRLQGLSFGDRSLETLTRIREQRRGQLARIRDEITLRETGIQPPGFALVEQEAAGLRAAIVLTQGQLDKLSQGPPPRTGLSAADLDREKQSVDKLTAGCIKCHDVVGAGLPPVTAARSVLVRAVFVHQPHLLPVQGDCFHCHTSIKKSKLSTDINFAGVESCRECHKTWSVRQDCATCHRYHPRSVP